MRGDVGFFVDVNVAAELEVRAALSFKRIDVFKQVGQQNTVCTHVRSAVYKTLGGVGELFTELDEFALGNAHAQHLAQT